MNVAILILFWSLLGWRFAFAEFFGGIIIIAVVTSGFSVLAAWIEVERLRRDRPTGNYPETPAAIVPDCPVCGMRGSRKFTIGYHNRKLWACSATHRTEFEDDPVRYTGERTEDVPGSERATTGWRAFRSVRAWRIIAATAVSDVRMLRSELAVGYLIAGFAAALIPQVRLTTTLQAVGRVPVIGYVLLLGLLITVVTYVCSMGNVPVARFLALAGVPLVANTAFIYGDLLVPPLIAIYRKSFPSRVVWSS